MTTTADTVRRPTSADSKRALTVGCSTTSHDVIGDLAAASLPLEVLS
ncbi:MAG: hypothetical protein ACRDZU_05365 [Acidimicrobiales bacterium]